MKKTIFSILVLLSTLYASDKTTTIDNCKWAYENKIYDSAITVCTEAALTYNDAKSAAILGMIYKNGLGTPKNGKRSLAMFKLAGERGIPLAHYWLSVYYRNGENGAEKNPSKSFYFCKEAADSGIDDAQFNLGNYYFEGFGTESNYNLAVRYWRLASSKGVADATSNLNNFCKAHASVDACNQLK